MRIFEIDALTATIYDEIISHNNSVTKSLTEFDSKAEIREIKKDKVYKEYAQAVTVLSFLSNKLTKKYDISFSKSASDIVHLEEMLNRKKYREYEAKTKIIGNKVKIRNSIIVANLCNDGNNVADVIRNKLGLPLLNNQLI